MAHPNFSVYASFGAKPTDSEIIYYILSDPPPRGGEAAPPVAGSAVDSSSDISSFVRSASYHRGRQHELNRIEAGTGGFKINDKLRYFDPDNTYGPYYPEVLPLVPIQMRAVLLGQTYTVMSQYVERWPRVRMGRTYAERDITTVDGFEALSHVGVGGNDYVSQLSGARITALLLTAVWPTAQQAIAAGQELLLPAEYTTDDSTTALAAIQEAVSTENGLFFINGAGNAIFLDRRTWISPPYSTSQATFTDIVLAAGELLYADIVPSFDKDLIFNDWRGLRTGGAPQTASDATSMLRYWRRTQQVSSTAFTDAQVLNQIQYNLAQYKDPLNRIESIKIKPGNNTDLWLQCLQREIGDRITVKEHPPGYGPSTSRDYLIQSIDATIKAGPSTTSEYVWGLFPADINNWMIFDNATLGRFDYNKLGY